MHLVALLAISAGLFAAVTWWCARQGLFDLSSMGIGFLIALFIYAIFWFAPTCVGVTVLLLARH